MRCQRHHCTCFSTLVPCQFILGFFLLRQTYSLQPPASRMHPQGRVSCSPPRVVMQAAASNFSSWQFGTMPLHATSHLYKSRRTAHFRRMSFDRFDFETCYKVAAFIVDYYCWQRVGRTGRNADHVHFPRLPARTACPPTAAEALGTFAATSPATSPVAASFCIFASAFPRGAPEMDLRQSPSLGPGPQHAKRCPSRAGTSRLPSTWTALELRAANARKPAGIVCSSPLCWAAESPWFHALPISGVCLEWIHALPCPTTSSQPRAGLVQRLRCIPARPSGKN